MSYSLNITNRSSWYRGLRFVRPAFVLFLLALLPVAALADRTGGPRDEGATSEVSSTRTHDADGHGRS